MKVVRVIFGQFRNLENGSSVQTLTSMLNYNGGFSKIDSIYLEQGIREEQVDSFWSCPLKKEPPNLLTFHSRTALASAS
jgi:hypothetical protein